MTKSRAEQMAESYVATELTWELCESAAWQEVAESTFLDGMKAMLVELEKYAQEIIEAEFPATKEQVIIVDKIVRDLRKLIGEE